MIWSVPILPSGSPTGATALPGVSLQEGAAGAYDVYFSTLAKALVAGGQESSIIRIGYEFNGSSFPWAALGQAANFTEYWRRIVDAMRSVPGANFKFVWNPYDDNAPSSTDLADYYPGNAYVDLIGLDVYSQSVGNNSDSSSMFRALETNPYGLDWLSSFAARHHKDLVLPQWGIGDAPSQNRAAASQEQDGYAIFVADMLHWIASRDVVEATYWDYGLGAVSSGSNPKIEAALAHWDE